MMEMGMPPSMMSDMDMDDMFLREMEMDRHMMSRREPRYRMDNSDDSDEEDGMSSGKLGMIQRKIKNLLPKSR